MSSEINIKSSTIEKGLELIKDFTQKLISPSVEEVGLLMSDKIRYFRFKNQVDILLKAKEYVKSKNINLKEVPTKILVPLLENASLEEDVKMQEKWAIMIGNLADSEQNLQNQIFPYILNQISINEFEKLREFKKNEKVLWDDEQALLQLRESGKSFFNIEYSEISKRVNRIKQEGFYVKGLEGFEYSNLQRLGLIKQLPPKIYISELNIDHKGYEESESYPIEAEYELDDEGYRITSLGTEFLTVCEEKTKSNE